MVAPSDTTDQSAPDLPARENALRRRHLRIVERWIPAGVEALPDRPERPNCGHLLGRCAWVRAGASRSRGGFRAGEHLTGLR